MPNLAYRADIDGLRAVAITAVVLCHAAVPGFSGGYVGVDIFFVISGYLITRIILSDLRKGSLKLSKFYAARIRRIAPALFCVLATTALAACLVFIPDDLVQFAKSAAWSALFAANIFFYRQVDYFGPSSVTQPLLHLWSLGVEEQFYIVFPLALRLMAARGALVLKLLLLILLAASLAAAIVTVHHSPRAAFYLAPLRAWELLLGSIATQWRVPGLQSPVVRNATSALGAALIIVPVVAFNGATTFPGLTAVPPCLGTALLIQCGERQQLALVSRLLSSRPFVLLGAISYSLYLWHWPVLVFARYVNLEPLTGLQAALSLLVMLLLAALTWTYIEQPARRLQLKPKLLIGAFAAASGGLVTASAVVATSNGLPNRFDAATRQYLQMLKKQTFFSIYDRGGCFLDYGQLSKDYKPEKCISTKAGRRVLIWGDSFAAHLFPGLKEQGDLSVSQYTATSCRPVLMGNTRCDAIYRDFARAVGGPFETVVISGFWGNYVDRVGRNVFRDRLKQSILTAKKLAPRVVLVGETPTFDFPIAMLGFMHPSARQAPEIVLKAKDDRELNAFLRGVAQANGVNFFDPFAVGCNGTSCVVSRRRQLLHWDEGHLTMEGSRFYAMALARQLREQPAR